MSKKIYEKYLLFCRKFDKIKMYVKKGDKVIVSKYAGTEVKYAGEEYIIVKQDDILAVVE